MSVSSILYPKFRAEDSNGDPLIGGKLYTYVPGSTLPKTTYSDLAQTVANTNPVILDSRGEATLFGTGDYKFILKDENDVTVWSLDAGVYQTAYVNNYYQVAATSGQTVFSLPWSYDHTGEAIRVYVNGAHQPRTAYECTSSTSVTMGTGVTAGQIVEFESITSAVVDTIFANVAAYEASAQTYAGIASVSASSASVSAASALASAVSASASAASSLASAVSASASAASAVVQVGLAADQVTLATAQAVIAAEQAVIAVEAADTALLQAPAWNGTTAYDYPQIVAATDGQTYRALGPTTGDNPVTDGGVHWAIVGVGIPSQAGNSGKVLGTDGSDISWVLGVPGTLTGGDAGKAIVVNPGETGYTLGAVQAPLESGTNIKTINSTSLLGSGDITVESFAAGDILLSARALSAPDWLPADGSAFLQASYPDLYAAIGLLKSYPPSKLSNPVTLPTGNGFGIAFSSDDTYMAVAHNTSPFITIYKRSGDTFTKLSDPATLPTSSGQAVAFSSDDAYMAVAHTTSPFITIYDCFGYDTSTLFIVPNVGADISTNAYIKP